MHQFVIRYAKIYMRKDTDKIQDTDKSDEQRIHMEPIYGDEKSKLKRDEQYIIVIEYS